MRAGSRAQNFNIGKGYDPMLFSIVSDELVGLSTLLGSIQYNGPVPERTLSNSCQLECNSFSNYQTSANDILIDDESDPKGISFLGKDQKTHHCLYVTLVVKRLEWLNMKQVFVILQFQII